MHAYSRTEVWPGPHNFNEKRKAECSPTPWQNILGIRYARMKDGGAFLFLGTGPRALFAERPARSFETSRTAHRQSRAFTLHTTPSPHTPPQLLHTCSHIALRTRSEESHPKGPPTSNARTRDLSKLGTRSSSKHTSTGTQSAAPQQVD